jgi:hypothetical protein
MRQWLSEEPFKLCAERIEWEILRLDARKRDWERTKQAGRSRQDKQSRVERAFTFVYVAGALESVFKSLDTELMADLKRVRVMRHELRPAALSLLLPRTWEDVGGDRVTRMAKRRDIVDAANNFYADRKPFDFSGVERLGLNDGRTVNVEHFEVVWDGLCLSDERSSVWLTNQHRDAVSKLAKKRNLIAHFEADPREEAFRNTYGDLHTMVCRVRDSVDRLAEHTLEWLDARATTTQV